MTRIIGGGTAALSLYYYWSILAYLYILTAASVVAGLALTDPTTGSGTTLSSAPSPSISSSILPPMVTGDTANTLTAPTADAPDPETMEQVVQAYNAARTDGSTHTVVSKCACGQTRLTITLNLSNMATEPVAIDCHCQHCRQYHVAALTSYLLVPRHVVVATTTSTTTPSSGASLTHVPGTCDELGAVTRVQCANCRAKLYTTGNDVLPHEMLVNLGPVDDRTLPLPLVKMWKRRRSPWQERQMASWTNVVPVAGTAVAVAGPRRDPVAAATAATPQQLHGRCDCGRHHYTIKNYAPPTELQHCYCRKCRKLSGGTFMSWLPVELNDFVWHNGGGGSSSSSSNHATAVSPSASPAPLTPPLIRTTPHGQRHICAHCGGILTIVYDEQPDLIWPAAGSIVNWPVTVPAMQTHLHRVIHICDRYRQNWYALPPDGLPRLKEAS